MTVVDQLAVAFENNFALIILSVAGFALGMFIYRKFLGKEGYKITPLSERVHDEIDDVVKSIGKHINTKLIYRLKTLGVVYKQYELTVKQQSDDDEDQESTRWLAFIVRPQFKFYNPAPAAMWYLFDKMFNLGKFEKIYLIPSRYVDRFDQIKISKDCDFAKVGGIYVPRSKEGLEFAKDQATISLYDDTLERFSDMIELMNFLDMKFSRDIQSLEKYYELESKKWRDRENKVVESG